ncbi:MAG: hypothetical protein A2V66_03435 [Ignavibacteria bacterium RBG_13_36_8]|nr:MAG: hypothetical protein A2V66_03435 [Ignavibacteria bacterium RBG_13_36_8]
MQLKLMQRILKENLSVRKVEQLVKKYLDSADTSKGVKPKVTIIDLNTLSKRDLENKLRQVFGTKVMCKQKKDGSGEITIEFYSNEELERLLDLFAIIEKDYN